jgi:hypothetical protein
MLQLNDSRGSDDELGEEEDSAGSLADFIVDDEKLSDERSESEEEAPKKVRIIGRFLGLYHVADDQVQ